MNNVNARDGLYLYRRMMEIRAGTFERLKGRIGSAELDALFKEVIAPHFPMGGCCALIHRGRVAGIMTVGEAVPGEPVGEDTLFRVASVSKMIGSLGIMALVEDGVLELDRDISDYLGYGVRHPGAPHEPITARQIMTHTTGLTDNGDYQRAWTDEKLPLHELFAGSGAARRNFTEHLPGRRYGYSNLGTGMLGAIIEKLTGKDYDAVMREKIFAPLNMDAAFYPQSVRAKGSLANIYRYPDRLMTYDSRSIGSSPPEDYPDPELHYTTAPGRLMISPKNVCVLMRLILSGGSVDGVKIIGEDSVAAMLERQDNIGSVKCDAQRGLNVMIAERAFLPGGRVAYGHQGSAYGAISEAYIELESGNGVVLATNGVWTRQIRPFARAGHDVVTAMFAVLDYLDENEMEVTE